MASMSYCMFRNTETEFQQCLDKITNIESLDDLSDGERAAAERMREMAVLFVEYLDQM